MCERVHVWVWWVVPGGRRDKLWLDSFVILFLVRVAVPVFSLFASTNFRRFSGLRANGKWRKTATLHTQWKISLHILWFHSAVAVYIACKYWIIFFCRATHPVTRHMRIPTPKNYSMNLFSLALVLRKWWQTAARATDRVEKKKQYWETAKCEKGKDERGAISPMGEWMITRPSTVCETGRSRSSGEHGVAGAHEISLFYSTWHIRIHRDETIHKLHDMLKSVLTPRFVRIVIYFVAFHPSLALWRPSCACLFPACHFNMTITP